MNTDLAKSISFRLLTLAVLLLLAMLAGFSIFSRSLFEPQILPELEKKAEKVATYVLAQLDQAVEWGIPVEKLAGTDELFDDILSDNMDIGFITVTDLNGKRLHLRGTLPTQFEAGLTGLARETVQAKAMTPGRLGTVFLTKSLPIETKAGIVGVLHVGARADYVSSQLQEVYYDLAIILLVSALFTFEILLYFVNASILRPIRDIHELAARLASGYFGRPIAPKARDELGRISARLDDAVAGLRKRYEALAQAVTGWSDEARARVSTTLEKFEYAFPPKPASITTSGQQGTALIRIAVFVFSLAEELTRTFLSVYIKELFDPVPGLAMEVVIGAPIALFMLLWAVAQPFAGAYSEKFGRRKIFLIGAACAAIGLLASGLSITLIHLLVARSITAIGYAMVFISAQGFVIDNTTRETRAQGMAGYAGGILTAGVCGPAIGGILADQIGFRSTFILSAVLALVAAVMVYRAIQERPIHSQSERFSLASLGLFIANPRFMGVVLFSAIPTKLALTALVFFLVPLYLNEQGISQSMIGRVLLLYWLAMIFVSPVASNLSDRLGNRKIFVVAGGILAAIAGVVAVLNTSIWSMVIGLTVLGIAHGLVMTPQLALVTTLSHGQKTQKLSETTVLSMFRLMERIGNVIAPFVAGLLLARYGYAGAITGIGYILSACTFICIILFVAFREPAAPAQEGRA
ncbi:MFS transporter [Elstera sp.]|jgi:MFS family permease/HAMP domain-containing protein|uniref:MFS transporter n=1 Tax=Elstera sp. TaxID=1916664 RepID=UPI0037BF7F8D